MSAFKGKTYNLKTRKYDVSMTSSKSKNISLLHWWNTSFLMNIRWKFCGSINIFHENIKENVRVCFFLNTVGLYCTLGCVSKTSPLWFSWSLADVTRF